MSEHLNNNSLKRFASLIGISSASVFFALPSLALVNANNSISPQSLNTRNNQEIQILAQDAPGTAPEDTFETTPDPAPEDTFETTPDPAPEDTFETTPDPVLEDTVDPLIETTQYMDDVEREPGTYICLNNPNPVCENPERL
ncbi:MAG: hypothetical protein KME06_19075 [Kastovskya adunca ATA6-11-RM4]|jgi:hypothetical protein|nr:hypothetical protein [Kastovskya adunca ATA6-11-RM4]